MHGRGARDRARGCRGRRSRARSPGTRGSTATRTVLAARLRGDGRGHRARPHRARPRRGGLRARPAALGLRDLQPGRRRRALHRRGRALRRADGLGGEPADHRAPPRSAARSWPRCRSSHTYPHCWRCKNPTLFRATEQWFIALDKDGLRAARARRDPERRALDPRLGRGAHLQHGRAPARLGASRASASGACRSWPSTARRATALLLEERAGRARGAASSATGTGADEWYARDAARAAARRARAAPKCGGDRVPQGDRHPRRLVRLRLQPRRGAGDAARSCAGRPSMYLEGSDQHRGWFHSSLLEAVGTRGAPPYRARAHPRLRGGRRGAEDVEVRRQRHHARGAACPKYGAEVLRLWVAAEDYTEDIRLSDEILDRARRRLPAHPQHLPLPPRQPRRLRSRRATARPYAQLDELDRWALDSPRRADRARARGPTRSTSSTWSSTRSHNFCAVDLSALYLDIIKDRLYTSAPDDPRRRAAQTVCFEVLTALDAADGARS